jgi:uncharacterized membrane protein YphA (DoxX/SURF4 family)
MYLDIALLLIRIVIGGIVMMHGLLKLGLVGKGGSIAGAHWAQGFWAGGGKVGWEFPVPLLAGALAIALAGTGAWSLDRLLGLAYPDWLLPAWLVLMAVGAALALGIRSIQAPKAAQS